MRYFVLDNSTVKRAKASFTIYCYVLKNKRASELRRKWNALKHLSPFKADDAVGICGFCEPKKGADGMTTCRVTMGVSGQTLSERICTAAHEATHIANRLLQLCPNIRGSQDREEAMCMLVDALVEGYLMIAEDLDDEEVQK